MRVIKQNNKEFLFLICDRLVQPIGHLYSTVLPWTVVHKIAFSDPRVLVGHDDDGNEVYRGIQRALSPGRVKQINQYVNHYEYATFPSSIILNLAHEKVDIHDIDIKVTNSKDLKDSNFSLDPVKTFQIERDVQKVLLIIPFEKSIAQIIDGQHRLSGFVLDSQIEFDLPITFFIDQTVEQQAEIFSTINGKQTRVTPSLVYELFGITNRKSPYKTAHNLVKVLNEDDSSPLRKWFKRLGKSNEFYEGFITQSTANQNFFKLISGNAKQADHDMRMLARGEDLKKETRYSRNKPVLREFFIKDDEESILKILFNFFNAVAETQTKEWSDQDSIFKRTIGFTALIKVLIDLVPIGLEREKLSKEFFVECLEGIQIDPNVTLSSKGINELYSQFKDQIKLE
jgi:DGQHR domain-containing protein